MSKLHFIDYVHYYWWGDATLLESAGKFLLMDTCHEDRTYVIRYLKDYWNNVHGFSSEDVKKDEEGLQTMRTLAKNMSWLLKSIEIGSKNGVVVPEYEEKVFTNFI